MNHDKVMDIKAGFKKTREITDQIIKDGIEKHRMILNIEDPNIHALIRYVLNIGFNNGYMAHKEDINGKTDNQVR